MSLLADCSDIVLDEIRHAIGLVNETQIDQLIEGLLTADQVFVVGVGRVMLSLQAFAKRLNHIGIRTHCVGDIDEPAITNRDLLIVGSGSGESAVPVAIARIAKQHGARVAHIGSNPESSLRPLTDIFVRIPVKTKLDRSDEVRSQQIMSSLFEQALFILGDIVALAIAKRKDLNIGLLWRYHANLE